MHLYLFILFIAQMRAAHRNCVDRHTYTHREHSALSPTVALARGPLRHVRHLPTHLIAIITVIVIIITVITAITATIDINLKFFFNFFLSLFLLFLLFYF